MLRNVETPPATITNHKKRTVRVKQIGFQSGRCKIVPRQKLGKVRGRDWIRWVVASELCCILARSQTQLEVLWSIHEQLHSLDLAGHKDVVRSTQQIHLWDIARISKKTFVIIRTLVIGYIIHTIRKTDIVSPFMKTARGGCSIKYDGGVTSSLLSSLIPLDGKPTDGNGTQRCESKTNWKIKHYVRNLIERFNRV